jgi:hypothetical protein
MSHPDLYRVGNTTNGGGWNLVKVPQDIETDDGGNVHPGDYYYIPFSSREPRPLANMNSLRKEGCLLLQRDEAKLETR